MVPLPVLEVGKGVITPNVDVEAGDTLTGSATLVDAVNLLSRMSGVLMALRNSVVMPRLLKPKRAKLLTARKSLMTTMLILSLANGVTR